VQVKSKESKIYTFIDSNNLNLGIESLGWKLDFKRFMDNLRHKLEFRQGENEKAPPEDKT